ncbi:MAG: ferrous iron transport protein [Verrucomicrobiaceae bacterium]|nr:ferrous iron transport protein [Verrucomicrobiaceae bacterium]
MSKRETNIGAAQGFSTEPLFALIGNPNSGKTTVFNALTGLRQKVANYPGVTVEKKIGECISQHGKRLQLIDLPGAYSLNARSPDEAVLRDVLLGRRADTPRPDRVICVVDAANIERNLYLVTQVLELCLPTIVVLNMMDVAEDKHWRINVERFAAILGVPVIPMQANSGKGLIELKQAMSRNDVPVPKWQSPPVPEAIRAELAHSRDTLAQVGAVSAHSKLMEPLYLISDHDPSHYGISSNYLDRIVDCRRGLEQAFPGWEDELVNARYGAVSELCREILHRPEEDGRTLTDRLDSVLLHPLWGGVSLFLVLGLLFYLMFSVAEGPMKLIEATFSGIGNWVQAHMADGDLRDLLVNGVIQGVGGVVVFLPQIMILFFFIGMMEDTGYMARIAFIMDRLMSTVGLNGKSFLPILSSHSCAVPGIMATRTIESPKDRLITILVSPLAVCSARVPVYLLLIAATVSATAVPIFTKVAFMLGLYFVGIAGTFFFAWLFNKCVMRGVSSPMILEMPSYKRPAVRSILLHMWERVSLFLKRAGTVILGLSILIWFASTYPKTEGATPDQQLANSFAGKAGHFIEPVIRPLGYDWKIGIGLISSFAAREVFVGTMGIIYAVEGGDDDENIQPIRERLREERWPDGRPVYTPLVCLSLMIFYAFAMQCMSTLAVVRRETNSWKWPAFQLVYMTSTAYVLSLLVYQVGTLLGF